MPKSNNDPDMGANAVISPIAIIVLDEVMQEQQTRNGQSIRINDSADMGIN